MIEAIKKYEFNHLPKISFTNQATSVNAVHQTAQSYAENFSQKNLQNVHLNPEKRDGFSNTHIISLFVKMQPGNNVNAMMLHAKYLNPKGINPLEEPGVTRAPGKMIVSEGESTLLTNKSFSDKQFPKKSRNTIESQEFLESFTQEKDTGSVKKEIFLAKRIFENLKQDSVKDLGLPVQTTDLNKASSSLPKGHYAEYTAVLPRLRENNFYGKQLGEESVYLENPENSEEKDFLKIISRCLIGVLIVVALIILYLSL